MRRPHIVPLSTQVIELCKQLKPITSHYSYIFIGRNNRSKPICKESVTQVIELLSYKGRATGHGFRHTMSMILHEQGFDSAWIEMQLTHVEKIVFEEYITMLNTLKEEGKCFSGIAAIF